MIAEDDEDAIQPAAAIQSTTSTPESLPVLIEFPGVLRSSTDPSGAITALGGISAVGSVLSSDTSDTALRLELRGGSEGTTSGIVGTGAEKTRRHYFVKVDVDTRDDDEIKAKVVEWTRIDRVVRFPWMADFQYFGNGQLGKGGLVEFAEEMARNSRRLLKEKEKGRTGFKLREGTQRRDSVDNGKNGDDDMETVDNNAMEIESRGDNNHIDKDGEVEIANAAGQSNISNKNDNKSEMEYLRPIWFARHYRSPAPPKYWFKQFSRPEDDALQTRVLRTNQEGNVEGAIDRRFRRVRYGQNLPYMIDIKTETIPIEPVGEIRRFESKIPGPLKQFLKVRLDERPVWGRRALTFHRPHEYRTQMKFAVPTMAYSFQPPSPFSHTWIRYGFDPRKDPTSRQYQTIEVRINDPVVIAAMKKLEIENPDEYPANFNIESLPCKRILYLQLCDIKDLDVAGFWNSLPLRNEFDVKTGFLTSGEVGDIVRKIKGRLLEMAEELLGEESCEAVRNKADRTQALRSSRGIRIARNRKLVSRKRGKRSQGKTMIGEGGGLMPYVNEEVGDIGGSLNDDERAAKAAAFSFAALQRAEKDSGEDREAMDVENISSVVADEGEKEGIDDGGKMLEISPGLSEDERDDEEEGEDGDESDQGSDGSFGEIEVFDDDDDGDQSDGDDGNDADDADDYSSGGEDGEDDDDDDG